MSSIVLSISFSLHYHVMSRPAYRLTYHSVKPFSLVRSRNVPDASRKRPLDFRPKSCRSWPIKTSMIFLDSCSHN